VLSLTTRQSTTNARDRPRDTRGQRTYMYVYAQLAVGAVPHGP